MKEVFTGYCWWQPKRVVQSYEEVKSGYCRGTYVVMWTNVSARFGIFRSEPLKDNIGLNRRDVMAILRAAYSGLTLSSFAEALEFCRAVGIKIGYYDSSSLLSYLVWEGRGA